MSSEEKNEELSQIEIKEYERKGTTTVIKSYSLMALLILLFIGILFFIGTLTPEFFVFIVFILLMSLPLIIIFRKKFYNILPVFVKNSLLEIDERDDEEKPTNYSVSTYWIQVLKIIFVILLCLCSIIFLNKFRKNYGEIKSIKKMLSSVLIIVIAGIVITDLN
jgi:hypothetical protein